MVLDFIAKLKKSTNFKKLIKFLGLSIGVFATFNVNGQCLNTISYGSAIAPASGTVTISTCNYQTEYSTISSVVAGTIYECALSSIGYVTIRSGSSSGPVVAHGNSPLQWTAIVPGNHYAHWNTNSLCGTAKTCITTTITFIASPTPPCTATLPQTEPHLPHLSVCSAKVFTRYARRVSLVSLIRPLQKQLCFVRSCSSVRQFHRKRRRMRVVAKYHQLEG